MEDNVVLASKYISVEGGSFVVVTIDVPLEGVGEHTLTVGDNSILSPCRSNLRYTQWDGPAPVPFCTAFVCDFLALRASCRIFLGLCGILVLPFLKIMI